jgi:hypothetical protein
VKSLRNHRDGYASRSSETPTTLSGEVELKSCVWQWACVWVREGPQTSMPGTNVNWMLSGWGCIACRARQVVGIWNVATRSSATVGSCKTSGECCYLSLSVTCSLSFRTSTDCTAIPSRPTSSARLTMFLQVYPSLPFGAWIVVRLCPPIFATFDTVW